MNVRFLLAPLIVLVFLAFTADDELLTNFLQNFEKHSQSRMQEKIYLHTDKPYYAIGDEIWFKAYLVEAATMRPSTQSGVMYVELIGNWIFRSGAALNTTDIDARSVSYLSVPKKQK